MATPASTAIHQQPATVRPMARAAVFVGGVVIVWLATIVWPEPARPDLDPSWQQVLVDAWIHGRRFGHDLVFTWGPWGFLFNTFFLPGALDAKLFFEAVGRLAISALLVAVVWSLPPIRRVAWVAALALFSHNMFDAVAVASFLHGQAWFPDGRPIRMAIGVAVLADWPSSVHAAWSCRSRDAGDGGGVALTGVRSAPMLVAGWRASLSGIGAGQQVGDLPLWIRLSLDVASGSVRHGPGAHASLLVAGALVVAASCPLVDARPLDGRFEP
jgi:hypothetical protein